MFYERHKEKENHTNDKDGGGGGGILSLFKRVLPVKRDSRNEHSVQ